MGKGAVSKLPATLRHDGRLALHLPVATHVGVGRVDDVTTANVGVGRVDEVTTANRRARVVGQPATRSRPTRERFTLRYDRISTAVMNLYKHNKHRHIHVYNLHLQRKNRFSIQLNIMISKTYRPTKITFAHTCLIIYTHASVADPGFS